MALRKGSALDGGAALEQRRGLKGSLGLEGQPGPETWSHIGSLNKKQQEVRGLFKSPEQEENWEKLTSTTG